MDGVLPVTTFFFWKFCFSLKTPYKELIWCSNYANIHIHTFRKRWSFISGWFFPVRILNSSFPYNTRSSNELYWRNPKTVKYGKETISCLALNLWKVPSQYMNSNLKNTMDCPCCECKTYLQHVGIM